jgi:hypothetical protein
VDHLGGGPPKNFLVGPGANGGMAEEFATCIIHQGVRRQGRYQELRIGFVVRGDMVGDGARQVVGDVLHGGVPLRKDPWTGSTPQHLSIPRSGRFAGYSDTIHSNDECEGCILDRLDAIGLFVRVVDSGSFSAVARKLGVGQPAVSKQIAALETHLGGSLSEANSRPEDH